MSERLAAFVDVETTGLNPHRDQIVELAVALFRFDPATGQILETIDQYSGLQEPTVAISRRATEIHGIHKRMTKGHALDRGRIDSIIERAEFLVSHHARFDHGFVSSVFPKVNQKPWHCSMDQIPWTDFGFSSKGLQPLLRDHGIDPGAAHRAMGDVTAALQLLNMEDAEGDRYLKTLLMAREMRFTGAPSRGPRRTGGRPVSHQVIEIDLSEPKGTSLGKKVGIGCLVVFLTFLFMYCVAVVG